MVRATAFAAGARVAFPSDAASLLKAAQVKNVVHIMPTFGPSTQSVKPGGMSTHSELLPNLLKVLRHKPKPLLTPLSSHKTTTLAIGEAMMKDTSTIQKSKTDEFFYAARE
ncbi:hypothetical protein C1H46_008846 [Malus baccata]|uniref:Uncharacterized protein n=1 Tax=Malus baccata TaxID=106549 RepID=A0A540N391_MALBA|nr:hypothetical protein C1H46_008846 [Malus baccata]